MRLALIALVFVAAAWKKTETTEAWIERVQKALAVDRITPKVMGYYMGLSERQIYDQLLLLQPMHAPRLEELWAAFPNAGAAYHIESLRPHYICLPQSRLTDALERIAGEKKAMASMGLTLELAEESA